MFILFNGTCQRKLVIFCLQSQLCNEVAYKGLSLQAFTNLRHLYGCPVCLNVTLKETKIQFYLKSQQLQLIDNQKLTICITLFKAGTSIILALTFRIKFFNALLKAKNIRDCGEEDNP